MKTELVIRTMLPTFQQAQVAAEEAGVNYALDLLSRLGYHYAADALGTDYWGYPNEELENLGLPTLMGTWAIPGKPVHEYHSKSEAYADGVREGFRRGVEAHASRDSNGGVQAGETAVAGLPTGNYEHTSSLPSQG